MQAEGSGVRPKKFMSVNLGGGSPATVRLAATTVHPLRIGEISSVMRLYRGQPAPSRALFHPLPFDRLRLGGFLLYVVATRRLAHRLLPHPRVRVAIVLTVHADGSDAPVGFGLVGFDRRGPNPRATFGYLVDERYRGRGLGTRLHEEMIDAALGLGVHRGGGTVLATNLPNLRLLERLGFTITPTEIRDAAATDVANFVTDGDLAAISARFHAAAGRPPVPPA